VHYTQIPTCEPSLKAIFSEGAKMGFFKPNIEKMRTRQDVEGLIKALKHKDVRVRGGAAVALERLEWKPRDDIEKVHYLIAKREWNDLAGLGGPAVESLIQALKDEDQDVRTGAAEALRKIGEPAVDPLIKALKDEKSDVRGVVAECLGEIGDARAVEPLIEVLMKGVGVYRMEKDGVLVPSGGIEKGLSLIGERAVEPLIQVLKDENPSLRARAAMVLGAIRDARAVEPLIEAMKGGDEDVVFNANMALRSIGEPAIEPLIKDEDWHVRQAAALALVVTGDARALEPLIQALKDEYRYVRMSVAGALGRLGDVRVVEPLKLVLKDEDYYVRESATEALEKIKAKKNSNSSGSNLKKD